MEMGFSTRRPRPHCSLRIVTWCWAAGWFAPPGRAESGNLIQLHRRAAPTRCPYCKSMSTERKSEFGSTACKALYRCAECAEPFESVKAI